MSGSDHLFPNLILVPNFLNRGQTPEQQFSPAVCLICRRALGNGGTLNASRNVLLFKGLTPVVHFMVVGS